MAAIRQARAAPTLRRGVARYHWKMWASLISAIHGNLRPSGIHVRSGLEPESQQSTRMTLNGSLQCNLNCHSARCGRYELQLFELALQCSGLQMTRN